MPRTTFVLFPFPPGRSFTITHDTEGERLGRGTKITLHMKEDQMEYIEVRWWWCGFSLGFRV